MSNNSKIIGKHLENKQQNSTTIKKAAMLEALTTSLGVVSEACRVVGLDRGTHYGWLKDDPEYREKVNELDNIALDFAESNLFKQIKNGEVSSTIFYLKTKGKKRGYVEKTELEVSGNIESRQPQLSIEVQQLYLNINNLPPAEQAQAIELIKKLEDKKQ